MKIKSELFKNLSKSQSNGDRFYQLGSKFENETQKLRLVKKYFVHCQTSSLLIDHRPWNIFLNRMDQKNYKHNSHPLQNDQD